MPENIKLNEGRQLFGLNPQGYEDARPDYPLWIFDHLRDCGVLSNGTPTLEIGAGTGKATRHLIEYGANPLTIVEPDARFATLLGQAINASPTHCHLVHDSFEDVVLLDNQFNLVVAATAFHWLDPVSALRKIKRLLKDNGVVALFWNVLQDLDKEDLFHDATHSLLAPLSVGPSEKSKTLPFALDRAAREAEANAAGFTNIDYRESRWSIVLTTDQVGKLYESFSHIQRLDADARANLLDELMTIADTQFNGQVVRNVTTCLYVFS
ncbi:MAG: class I SAM-dependent methyltransferase [Chloroflexota bacterium]